jgi:hypothetical protein
MNTYDDETPLEFFEEPETLESPGRQRRRMRPSRPGGPRRPSPPPPGAVALARLAGLVGLAIAVVVGLVFWVGSCQGKSRHDEYASYMNDVRAIAQSSAATGTAALASEFQSTKLTLPGLQAKLGQWSKQQQEQYDTALRLRPPAPLQAAHQQILAALQLRAIGLTRLANTLATSGSKSASQVANLLANQAQLLDASDLVWVELFKLPATDIVTRLGVKGVSPPPSRIVTNPEVISANSFETVWSRLNATNPTGKVTGLRGSELVSTEAVTGGQATQLTTSGSTKVSVAADLTFRVTFKNGGNFPEGNVPVTLTVDVFGHQALTRTKKVLSVLKGQTATVEFGNLRLPNSVFGGSATVHIKVGKVPGETKLDNNSASYPVFFSLGSGG